MSTQVYTLHIAYDNFENKIWRTVEISGNNTLAQVGYLILATFDTLAYHAFEFTYKNTAYALPMILEEEPIEGAVDSTRIKLRRLGLSVGDRFEMEYDYGCPQIFKIRVDAITEMEHGRGRHYPYILDGRGRGILDDVSANDFGDIIAQIDAAGKSDYHVERDGSDVVWDYREFDIEYENIFLKETVAMIREGYECEE